MVRTRFTLNLSSSNIPFASFRNLVFSWLYARRQEGRFLLRADDIDAENRPVTGKIDETLDTLKWLGISWDDEVLRTGQRLTFYRNTANELLKEGRAYPCYCTPKEIEDRKKERAAEGLPQHYDGRCRNLTSAQIKKFEAEGRTPSIRFMAYDETFKYNDMFKGNIAIPAGTVGDFVILRSNGTPIGLFAEAADDSENGTTNLFKTEEPLSGLVRQLMVYKSLGKNMPKIAQLPAITDCDGKKLSRQSPVKGQNVEDLRALGYFPEALVNFFALLGWNNPDGREIILPDELKKVFDPEKYPSSSAVYDQGKLDWIARHYILNEEKESLFEKAAPFIHETGNSGRDFLKGVVELVKGYCSCLSEIRDHAVYFINDDFPYTGEAETVLKRKETAAVLKSFRGWIETDQRDMDENVFGEMVVYLTKKTDVRGRALFTALRAALTGRTDGPEIYYLIPVIGKERTLSRIDRAAGLSG